MKKMKPFMLLLIAGLCAGAQAEMRTWTLKSGKTMEAEMIRTYFDKIVLKDGEGTETTLPRDAFNFSDADLEYLDLENIPKLQIEFRKSIEKKNFAMIRGAEDRPPEWRGTFGAKISLKDRFDYNYPLTVEFFAIGEEIIGDRFILLDRKVGTFTPSKENKWTYEFYSDRIVRMTDLWDNSENFSRRGEQYSGYIITVRDKRGKIIAVNSSRDWLESGLDNLGKLGIGNYMDKQCLRTYPTRPKSYMAARAAGRS